jgi:SGNH hydrolase-like domain, acetyltransferase AlgX
MPTELRESPVSPDARPVSEAVRPVDKKWRLIGKLAPSIVIAWVVIDLLSRFINPAVLHVDPWLTVSRFPPRYAPFSRDQSFIVPKYVGANARTANIPPTEFTGPITFSTDHLGFRANPYLKSGQGPQVLFVKGDSFIYGVGLSDNETLPSVLTGRYGIPSYNGARFHDDPDGLPEMDWLLDHLPSRPTTIVYTYLEHGTFLSPQTTPGLNGLIMRRDPVLDGDLRYLKMLNMFFWQMSPPRIVTTRFFNSLENDKVFPNENAKTIQSLALPNGEKLLFRDYEYELATLDRGPAAVAQSMTGFRWFKSELDKRHLRLVVLLLPNRYTIYAPLLGGNDGPWAHYLDHLDVALQKEGIETVNGLDIYRASARQEVNSGQLSFYREDTHWNARGVELIAKPLADAINHNSPASLDRDRNAVQ